ncbi:MAG: hypothetical protein V4616_10220 [Bacteroidota bacterium]
MIRLLFIYILLFCFSAAKAQEKPGVDRNQLRFNLDSSGNRFIKATLINQVWVRFNQNNPGSQQFGYDLPANSFDVGIRRLRFQLFGQLTDRVFFYSQFGMNNFSVSSPRFSGAFFHDAALEYKVKERYLSIGAGLSSWGGYLRMSAPAVGGILGIDAPLYQQATNSTTDQFLRKLGVYAKGKIGKLDYRVMLASPMAPQNSPSPLSPIGPRSNFSLRPAHAQIQSYISYQFFDEESNLLAFNTGTYSGKKRVFNIGAGFVNQAHAMWHRNADGDTVTSTMTLFGADVFYDAPLNTEKGTAISVYAAVSGNEFGPGYLRNNNAMNIANSVNNPANLGGPGNAFPMLGTGSTAYLQAGYKFRNNLLPDGGTLTPYASVQHSRFKSLPEHMNVYELGLNWLIHGSNLNKITLGIQNRPVYTAGALGAAYESGRRNQVVVQFQAGL